MPLRGKVFWHGLLLSATTLCMCRAMLYLRSRSKRTVFTAEILLAALRLILVVNAWTIVVIWVMSVWGRVIVWI